MTDLLWMPPEGPAGNPNYLRRFDAEVTKARGDWLLLDRTAFYAEGGGQPADTGTLAWDGGEARVTHVSKRGVVKHEVDGSLPDAGTQVTGEVDWDRRYAHMRMHTSQHVVSAEAHRLFGARTVGNAVTADATDVLFDRALDAEALEDLRDAVDAVTTAHVPVTVRVADRAAIEEELQPVGRVDFSRLPASVRRLRVVDIGEVDACPCAGTHVADTREIGALGTMTMEPGADGGWVLRYGLAEAARKADERKR